MAQWFRRYCLDKLRHTDRWTDEQTNTLSKSLTCVMINDFKDGLECSLRTDEVSTIVHLSHPVVLYAWFTRSLIGISDGQYIGHFVWKKIGQTITFMKTQKTNFWYQKDATLLQPTTQEVG